MKASLVSREVIADSIELVARVPFDGLVLIVGCDKTIPAAAMALARLNIRVYSFLFRTINLANTRPRQPQCRTSLRLSVRMPPEDR